MGLQPQAHPKIGSPLYFEFIEDNGISLKDLRGQSYDNASNMSQKYKGMEAIIKESNDKRNIFLV